MERLTDTNSQHIGSLGAIKVSKHLGASLLALGTFGTIATILLPSICQAEAHHNALLLGFSLPCLSSLVISVFGSIRGRQLGF